MPREEAHDGYNPRFKEYIPYCVYSNTKHLGYVYQPEVLKYGRDNILCKLTVPTVPDIHIFWCPVNRSVDINKTVVRLKFTPKSTPELTWVL